MKLYKREILKYIFTFLFFVAGVYHGTHNENNYSFASCVKLLRNKARILKNAKRKKQGGDLYYLAFFVCILKLRDLFINYVRSSSLAECNEVARSDDICVSILMGLIWILLMLQDKVFYNLFTMSIWFIDINSILNIYSPFL